MNVRTNGSDAMYYVHTDHLGSLSSVYNASGSKIAEQSFDPWGRYRNPSTWQPLPPLGGAGGGLPAWLIRGYTGHEQLPQFGLINMNARLYDPLLAHVVSPDNYVQFPDFTQSYNRFSYCINNPLKYTDPTGNDIDDGEAFEGEYDDNGNFYVGGRSSSSRTLNVGPNAKVNTPKPENNDNDDDDINRGQRNPRWVKFLRSIGINITSYYGYGKPSYDRGSVGAQGGGGGGPLYAQGPGPSRGDGGGIDKGLVWTGRANDFADAFGKVSMVGTGKAITRITVPVGVAIGFAQIKQGYSKDGNQFGYNAQKATTGFVGGLAGAWAGFQAGSTIGFEGGFAVGAAFGGIGAIPEGVIGGILGGFGGAFGGAYYGGQLGESLITNK